MIELTSLLYAILFGCIGAIANRIRGGGLVKQGNTAIFLTVWFSAAMFIFTTAGSNPWPIPDYVTAFLFILGIYIGETFGWGRYFGAMKDPISKFKSPADYDEVKLIDWVIKGLVPSKTKDSERDYKLKTRLWGFTGMSLRGLLWKVFPAIPLMSIIPLIVGLTMGTVYYISRKAEYHWERQA
jgi:hypothetical protein